MFWKMKVLLWLVPGVVDTSGGWGSEGNSMEIQQTGHTTPELVINSRS